MHLTVEFKAAECQVVRSTRVLADLDDTEEAIAISAELAVDLCVDSECHGTTSSLEVLELSLERGVAIRLVRLVDTCI